MVKQPILTAYFLTGPAGTHAEGNSNKNSPGSGTCQMDIVFDAEIVANYVFYGSF